MSQLRAAPYYGLPKQPKKRWAKTIAGALIIVAVLGGSIGWAGTHLYQAYQASLQPNIQATAVFVQQPITNPQLSRVFNGAVAGSGSFDFTPDLPGVYTLVFNNTLSNSASRTISLTYTGSGITTPQSFTIPAGYSKIIPLKLNAGDRFYGSFTVTGGSLNDINFYITGQTCTQTISFSFTLVNPGRARGFAMVQFSADGQTVWNNKYLVPQGQQLPENGTVTLPDCIVHSERIVVFEQEKV